MSGKIKAICISSKRGIPKSETDSAELIADWGIQGDAHAAHWHRQISLLSFERIEEFRRKGAEAAFGAFGENLVVEGYDFGKMPVGTRFKCNDVILEITQIGKECHSHCEIYKKMGDCIMPKEGVFAAVIKGGTLRKGDRLEMTEPDVYQTIADRNRNSECMMATILDGDMEGNRCLWIDGILRFHTDQSGFLLKHKGEILGVQSSQLIRVDGISVFCERIGTRHQLVICGAGHVSISIIQIGKQIGFGVTVVEDRPKFADDARIAGADEVLCDDFEHALLQIPGSMSTYFVIVTRGHRYDLDCLKPILKKPNAYIGMMGSRKKVAIIKKLLSEEGFDMKTVEKIHMPIGLSIGAESPEEIAISVLAELIQEKNKVKKVSSYVEPLLSYLIKKEGADERWVLASVVDKRGSAPRAVGTKMLINPLRQTVGTIGGGCIEGEVIMEAISMLNGGKTKGRLITVDLSNDDAEKDGMVCGGTIKVFLELLS